MYICLVTPPPPPPRGRTTSFPRHLTLVGQFLTPCKKKLGCLSFTGCDETGSMLSRVALLDCLGDAIASFIGCWKVAQKLGQNVSQNSPAMQFHATRTQAPSIRIRLCLKTGIFSPPFAKKCACTSSVFALPSARKR